MAEVRHGFQFRNRTLLIVTTIVLIVLAGFAVLRWSTEQAIEAMMVGNTGAVESRDDWPQPLKALTDESDGIEIDESTVEVHCLCQGFDPEYVWRMDAAPGLFEGISQRWKLSPVDDPKWYVLSGRSQLSGEPTPSWWSPQRDGQTSFFACPQTLGGHKGDRFQVAFDKKRNVIYVHYWFNF